VVDVFWKSVSEDFTYLAVWLADKAIGSSKPA
jgi:hypothetical protein